MGERPKGRACSIHAYAFPHDIYIMVVKRIISDKRRMELRIEAKLYAAEARMKFEQAKLLASRDLIDIEILKIYEDKCTLAESRIR